MPRKWIYGPAENFSAWLTRSNPKGLMFIPPIFALFWPTATEHFTFDPIPLFFWERLSGILIGITLSYVALHIVKRYVKHEAKAST